MINTQPYKAMYKSELARAAGVTCRTFNRWLRQHKEDLRALECSPRCQLLNPAAVRYICEHFCIDLDDN